LQRCEVPTGESLFDDEDLELKVLETLPIASDMPALQRVARLFELQVF